MKAIIRNLSQRWFVVGVFLAGCLLFAFFLMNRDGSADHKNRVNLESGPVQTTLPPASSGASNKTNLLVSEKPPAFTPSDEFKYWFSQKTVLPWCPFRDFHLANEVAEGMQLQTGEEKKLKNALDRFMVNASTIQEEDAYYSKNDKGNYIILLLPKKQKWLGMENQFREEVIQAIGPEKSEYFFQSSREHLDLVTGMSGQATRSIEVENFGRYGVEGEYSIKMEIGSMVVPGNSRYFTSDEQKNFGRVRESPSENMAMISFKIENTPVYLKPIMEKIQKMESSSQ